MKVILKSRRKSIFILSYIIRYSLYVTILWIIVRLIQYKGVIEQALLTRRFLFDFCVILIGSIFFGYQIGVKRYEKNNESPLLLQVKLFIKKITQ